MKRTIIAGLLALTLAPAALAQGTGTQQSSQPASPQQSGQQQQQPGATQQPGTAPGSAQAPAAPGAGHLPGTKAQPQAQSQPEYDAYLAVVQAPDVATAEAAANDFASNFPASSLRAALYHVLMMKYSQENNVDKTIEMGRKAIEADPDNPVVLALLASTIAETTREADLDFEEKSAEVVKLGERAVQTADTSITVPPTVTAEELVGYRARVKALAHGAVGKVLLQKQDYTAAEKHLRAAIELSKGNPADAAGDYLRLSIALDKQRRYQEALEAAKQAMTLGEPGGQVATLAKQQHDRLLKLVPGGAGASTTTTPTGAAAPGAQPAATPPASGQQGSSQPQKPQGTTPR